MQGFLAAMFLLLNPAAQPAAPVAEEAVIATIRQYHAAFAAGDAAGVTRVLGPSYFMGDERPAESAKRVQAHMFLSGDRLRSWPLGYLKEVAPHKNTFETLSVSIRGDAAVVLTRDTGSNRFREWEDEETAWFLGKVGGEWRIVGMVIRDIQLPK